MLLNRVITPIIVRLKNATYLGPWWWSSGQRACLHSDDLSSNPAEACSFFCNIVCLKRTKMNQKVAGVGPLEKMPPFLKIWFASSLRNYQRFS